MAERNTELHDPYATASPAKALLQTRVDLLRQLHAQDVELAETRERLARAEDRLRTLEEAVAALRRR